MSVRPIPLYLGGSVILTVVMAHIKVAVCKVAFGSLKLE